MRILMFGWEFPPRLTGGLALATQGLVRGLADVGHDITLVLPGSADNLTPGPGVRIVSLERSLTAALSERARALLANPYAGPPIAGLAAGTEAVAALVADTPFDVIHCHDWLTVGWGVEARRLSGRPLLLHMHSLEVDRSPAGGDADIRRTEEAGLGAADAVVAVSRYSRSRIVAEYGIAPQRVTVVHNGLSLDIACSASPGRPPVAPGCVLFLGRMTWQKGPGHFLHLAQALVQRQPGLRFVMAGTGDLLEPMRELALGLGLAEAVDFPGYVDRAQVAGLFAQADVLVMPSESEPFGLVALEAAACGVPVVLSPKAGVREVLAGAPAVDPAATEAAADLVLRMLTDGPERQAVCQANLAAARACTWAEAARTMDAVYSGLVAGAESPLVGAPGMLGRP